MNHKILKLTSGEETLYTAHQALTLDPALICGFLSEYIDLYNEVQRSHHRMPTDIASLHKSLEKYEAEKLLIHLRRIETN